jgi:YD repeat-containing protein
LRTVVGREFSVGDRLRDRVIGSRQPLERVRYGYDLGDRVSTITDLLASSRNRSFGYDARGRLDWATGPYGTDAAPATRYYAYDPLRVTPPLGAPIFPPAAIAVA